MSRKVEKSTLSWKSIRNAWEFKLIETLLRLFVAACVVFYFTVTSLFTYTWVNIRVVELQDISRFEGVVQKAIEKNDFDKMVSWMNLRPATDTKQINDVVQARAEELPAAIFISLSRRYEGDEKEFLQFLGKYRLRFDLLRCGGSAAVDKMDRLMQGIQKQIGIEPAGEALISDPAALAEMLTRVLDYDAKYPARNNPQYMCKSLSQSSDSVEYGMSPEEQWTSIRHMLRLITEENIKKLRAEAGKKK